MYRTTTCVVNATHARMLLTDKWLTDYGFRKPAPTTIPFDADLHPILGPVRTAAASAPKSPAPAPSSEPDAAGSAAPPPTDYTNELTPHEMKTYSSLDAYIKKVDAEMLNTILSCVPSTFSKQDYRKQSKDSGAVLLAAMHKEREEMMTTEATLSGESKVAEMIAQGIAEPTV